MKALFSILDPQNRVETNTCFVFAHDFVLASRYLHFFPLLTYITDSKKFLRCLLFTDGRLQLQHSDTSTKSVKRRMLKHRKWRGKINVKVDKLPDNWMVQTRKARKFVIVRDIKVSVCSLNSHSAFDRIPIDNFAFWTKFPIVWWHVN